MAFSVYKRGGRPLDPLVLSKDPAAVKLRQATHRQGTYVAGWTGIMTACTPKTADDGCEAARGFDPAVAIDAAPLLAKDGERLKKLVLDTSEYKKSCMLLVKGLCGMPRSGRW